jgi:amino acid adenylation domain-containing protein
MEQAHMSDLHAPQAAGARNGDGDKQSPTSALVAEASGDGCAAGTNGAGRNLDGASTHQPGAQPGGSAWQQCLAGEQAAWELVCLPQLFEAQVERTPHALAVEFEDQRLTYRELNCRANQLAHYLRARGVGPEVLVGICILRSLDMVVGLLGILKAGGAYVPLETSYPRERLAFMIEDTQAPVLLTQEPLRNSLPDGCGHIICLDSDWPAIAQSSDENLVSGISPDNLAYVIYTSGSTGKPKGAMIEHQAISNHMLWMGAKFPLSAQDSVLQKTPFSFDASVWEFYAPLLAGARLVMARPGGHADPAYLASVVTEKQVTTLQLVPSLLALLVQQPGLTACRCLRRVFCGGEALSADLARKLYQRLPGVELVNLYGPTECTIDATFWTVAPGVQTSVPIGRPIANMQAYVLDEDLHPVPSGVAGELHLGGIGLGRGYLRRPEQTAAKFIPNPFSDQPGARLYKTGDLVRSLPDGALEYLGRLDHQVKIRGYRIELGEIEAVLTQYPGVRQALVVAREDAPGDKRLVAYLVADRASDLSASALRTHLRGQIPEYMVPSAFVPLDAFPLTPNGKVDRKALPPPQVSRPNLGKGLVSPRNDHEQALTRIWEALLRVQPVSVKDDFFELGGDSVKAAQMLAQVREVFGRELPLSTLVNGTTVEHLAGLIQTRPEPGPSPCLVPLQPQGSKPPLFLVHGVGGEVLTYTTLPRHLGADQPIYGLRARGAHGTQAPLRRVEEMAAHYVEEVRSVTRGPVFLGGFSFGGILAFEMARQLQAQGIPPALLVIFDIDVPHLYLKVIGQLKWFYQFASNLPRWVLHGIGDCPPGQRVAYLRRRVGIVKEVIQNLAAFSPQAPASLGVGALPDLSHVPENHRRVWEANHEAFQHYAPRPYDGRVTLIRCRTQPLIGTFEHDQGWGRLATGGVDVTVVPGFHGTLFKEPQVQRLARRLRQILCKGQRIS